MRWYKSEQCPDTTYFRVGDCDPRLVDGAVVLFEGEGSRRSWGRPQVNVTVIVDECDLLSVLVGFSHKHGGGQFYRHYIAGDDGPERRNWRRLTEDERTMIRASYETKAPHWAKSPGKLSEERRKASDSKFPAYKILRVVGEGEYISLYDNTKWKIGKRNTQAVGDAAVRWSEHDGGYYVHRDAERIVALFKARDLVPERCYDEEARYALVKCECYGRRAEFSSGKIAVTYCTPVVEVKGLAL